MSWKGFGRSDTIDDNGRAAGSPGFGTGQWGLGVIVVLGVLGWGLGIDPRHLISGAEQIQQARHAGRFTHPLITPHRRQAAAPRDQIGQLAASVLAETQDVWSNILPKQEGIKYVPPQLLLYKIGRTSACGPLYTAMGPIYCPLDNKIYLDPSFFEATKGRFGDAGSSADLFMIAHEIGHRVQDQLGILRKAWTTQRRGFSAFGNAISIRIELMADCFAGVWANHAEMDDHLIKPSDVEKMIETAQAIGDDQLQLAALGRVLPSSFTHGTSAQRVQWFETGLTSGRVEACDTFGP